MPTTDRWLRVRALVVCLSLLPLGGWCQAPDPEPPDIHLVILHVNDVHGHLDASPQPDGTTAGGCARLATLVQRIRAENPNRVLLLHAGDILSKADALTIWYAGDVNFEAMNLTGFDALTPGNGDFYFGLENLLRLRGLARFPLLHANTLRRDTGQHAFEAATVREISGVRVGIFGVGRVRADLPSAADLRYLEPVPIGVEQARELRPKVDVVVALTHIGLMADMQLAALAPEIDLIVGGDSHSRLDQPVRAPRPQAQGEVVITQAGENGQFLGRVDVYLATGRTPHPLRRVEACLLPLGADVPQDPAVLAVLARHGAPLGESQFTCEAEVQNPAKGTSPMGVLVADALRAGANAQVGLLDRDAVASGLTPGPGTIADVCRVHPWRNRVLVGSLTGAQVQKALAGARVHASGCELQRTGPKVTGLTVGGLPAAPENTYSVAAGEYLVQTTPWLRDLSWRDSGARVETLLLRYLKQRVVVR